MAARRGQQLNPEEVRRKWDALLDVINNVATGTAGGDGAEAVAGGRMMSPGDSAHQGSQLQAARELLAGGRSLQQSSGDGPPPRKTGKPDWDGRHYLAYSSVNSKMQKNIRSYFDRPRDIEAYGTRHDLPLRTIWQLDTPVEPPPPGSKQNLSPTSAARQKQLQMTKSTSAPSLTPEAAREAKWDVRHQILFTKDNHHYHSNLRDYFERPRHLLV